MQYLDIRCEYIDFNHILRKYKAGGFIVKPQDRKWANQQRLDYLHSLLWSSAIGYTVHLTRPWIVKQSRENILTLLYGQEQFLTLLDVVEGMINYGEDYSFQNDVYASEIVLCICKPSLPEADVQEVIRRFLSE